MDAFKNISSLSIAVNSSNETEVYNDSFATVWKFVPPILIPLGVTENIISIVVLCQKKFNGMPSRVTLISLAIIDSLVLFFGLFRYWMAAVFLVHPNEYSVASCKILVFLVFALSHISSSLVALVSIERLISVWFPHRVKTLAIDSIGVPVVIVFCTLINLHLLGTTVLVSNPDWKPNKMGSTLHKNTCINESELIAVIVDVLDTLMLSYLPFALIVFCNVAIIYRLRQNSRKFRKGPAAKDNSALVAARASLAGMGKQVELEPIVNMASLPAESTGAQLTIPHDTLEITIGDNTEEGVGMMGGRRKSAFEMVAAKFKPRDKQMEKTPKTRANRRDARVTNMLLLVTFTFFFCNLPFALIHLIRTARSLNNAHGWNLAWTVSYVFVFMNNCLNFPIYMISQPSFREELARLCCCDKCFLWRRKSDLTTTAPTKATTAAININRNGTQ